MPLFVGFLVLASFVIIGCLDAWELGRPRFPDVDPGKDD